MPGRKRPATKDEILTAVRSAVRAADGKRIRLRAFLGSSHIKTRDIYAHFPSWNALLRAAGFDFDQYNQRIDDIALLTDWATVARKLQRPPSAGEYRRHGAYSISAITRRFRGWNPIRQAFRAFAVAQPQWNDVLALIPPPPSSKSRRSRSATSSSSRRSLSEAGSRHTRLLERPRGEGGNLGDAGSCLRGKILFS